MLSHVKLTAYVSKKCLVFFLNCIYFFPFFWNISCAYSAGTMTVI